MYRTIVIGDVHGCLEELDELLKKCQFQPFKDQLIFTGDLIDRGPDPAGVIARAREYQAKSALGNHEEKYLRWTQYERARSLSGKKNPMNPHPDRIEDFKRLSSDDFDFIAKFSPYLEFGINGQPWIVVHGGLEAGGKPVEAMKAKEICRIRYVDKVTGLYIHGERPTDVPENGVDWMTAWDKPSHVIYGHAVHSLERPRIDPSASGMMVMGIDTGCVFGGRLTAAIFEESLETVQVQAKQEYFPRGDRGRYSGED